MTAGFITSPLLEKPILIQSLQSCNPLYGSHFTKTATVSIKFQHKFWKAHANPPAVNKFLDSQVDK